MESDSTSEQSSQIIKSFTNRNKRSSYVEVDVESLSPFANQVGNLDFDPLADDVDVFTTLDSLTARVLSLCIADAPRGKHARTVTLHDKLVRLEQAVSALEASVGVQEACTEDVADIGVVEKLLRPATKPLILQPCERNQVAALVIGTLRSSNDDLGTKYTTAVDKLSDARRQMRDFQEQILFRDRVISNVNQELQSEQITRHQLEAELEKAYSDLYGMDCLVKELNSELAGAKFVIQDSLRTAKGGLAAEFMTRSIDFDGRINDFRATKTKSAIDLYLPETPRRQSPLPSCRPCDISEEWQTGDEQVPTNVKRYRTKSSIPLFRNPL